MRSLPLATFLLGFVASESRAQIPFVNELFKNVHDVNTSFGFGTIDNSPQLAASRMRVINFELTFSVASLGCRNVTDKARDLDQCARKRLHEAEKKRLRTRCELEGDAPRNRRECERQQQEDAWESVDTKVTTREQDGIRTTSYKKKEPEPVTTASIVGLEFGLSYGRVRGFHSKNPTLDLTGALEEFPVVASYATFALGNGIDPYLGARAGLTKFDGLRAYAGDTVFKAEGSTFLLGGGLGFGIEPISKLFFYAEADYTWRGFPSIAWADSGKVRPCLPRRLSFNTVELSFGLQLAVR